MYAYSRRQLKYVCDDVFCSEKRKEKVCDKTWKLNIFERLKFYVFIIPEWIQCATRWKLKLLRLRSSRRKRYEVIALVCKCDKFTYYDENTHKKHNHTYTHTHISISIRS